MPPPGAEPLLAAVLANPDDDLVRVVYADWLDETGTPEAAARAEFIRIQIELAGLGYEGANPKRKKPESWDTLGQRIDALIHRQNELWDEHGPAWRAELPPCPGTTFWFTRGFATWADVQHPGGLMRDGDKLFAAAPITRLSFRDPPLESLAVPILDAPWFDRIRKLSVAYNRHHAARAGDEIADLLKDSPRTTHLRELVFAGTDMSDHGAVAIGISDYAANLTRLDLSENRIGNYGAEILLRHLNPERLQSLNLSDNPILGEYRRQFEGKFPGRVRFV